MFENRRDLFSELTVVFMDTTSLSFTGAGGEALGERGYSKDHRPDLLQMIVGVVIDAAGRPVCSEMWPGNTADVSVLVPVIDRLRSRFGIGRVCVVADRGMISAPTIAALEERGLEYVLGRARAHRQPGAHRGACGSEAVYALVHPTRHGQRAAPDRDAVITALKPDHGPVRDAVAAADADDQVAVRRPEGIAGPVNVALAGDLQQAGGRGMGRSREGAGHEGCRDDARCPHGPSAA